MKLVLPRSTFGQGDLAGRAGGRFKDWNRRRLDSRRIRHADRRGEGPDYTQWVAQFDTIDDAKRAALIERANKLPPMPIAIVMPVYNPSPAWLAEAIDSVIAQAYPHWELCIADDLSTDPASHRDARCLRATRQAHPRHPSHRQRPHLRGVELGAGDRHRAVGHAARPRRPAGGTRAAVRRRSHRGHARRRGDLFRRRQDRRCEPPSRSVLQARLESGTGARLQHGVALRRVSHRADARGRRLPRRVRRRTGLRPDAALRGSHRADADRACAARALPLAHPRREHRPRAMR